MYVCVGSSPEAAVEQAREQAMYVCVGSSPEAAGEQARE